MQETKSEKITCRCCGHRFHYASHCPLCGYPVVVVLGGLSAQVEADAKKAREEHPERIITKAGVVFNKPATWNGDQLVGGDADYLELAAVSDLTEAFKWNNATEFASFGRGREARLKVYFEKLDGSKEVKTVKIALPLVRGVTWKADVRMAESGDGVIFAVGVPERFTETGVVKFRD